MQIVTVDIKMKIVIIIIYEKISRSFTEDKIFPEILKATELPRSFFFIDARYRDMQIRILIRLLLCAESNKAIVFVVDLKYAHIMNGAVFRCGKQSHSLILSDNFCVVIVEGSFNLRCGYVFD